MTKKSPIQVKRAAVIGSGVMGSAIAAHFANAGIPTLLLDIVPRDLSEDEKNDPKARNRIANEALKRAQKAKPAPFFSKSAASIVQTGNLEDDAAKLSHCDLVIEAVLENLDIKRSLFQKIGPHLADHAVLASNTSGLSIAAMNEAVPAPVRERFLVMHFFNPVRYMHLLELVAAPDTSAEVMTAMTEFGEFLGKGIVYGKDTTNFVANRIGVMGIMASMHLMQEHGLSIADVDAILGKAMGRPKSAAYKTCDIVGIDTMIHVAKNCYDQLLDDEERALFKMPAWVVDLVEQGHRGRKSGAGFYKKAGRDILVYDPDAKDYKPLEKPNHASLKQAKSIADVGERIRSVLQSDDAAARYGWAVTSRTLAYAARRVGEISDDLVNIDRAMRWGFNWDLGPFEIWDALGVQATVDRMKADGIEVPAWVDTMLASGRDSFYQSEKQGLTVVQADGKGSAVLKPHPKALSLQAIREKGASILASNASASLLDLGDGVACFEVHTKMNTIDQQVIDLLQQTVDLVPERHRALVIGNQSENFGAGANVALVLEAALKKDWDSIQKLVVGLQDALQQLRYAPYPVVAAPYGLTLGGVCEVAMAADACQAHAETYIGLVEIGVGLIPAGGGCMRVARRFTESVSDLQGVDLLTLIGPASLNVATAKVSTGAEDARALRYLRKHDGITMHRDFLLHDAKARAIGMAEAGYRPDRPVRIAAAGPDAKAAIAARVWGMVEGGFASAYDAKIANMLAHILTGGAVRPGAMMPEQHFLDLELEAFMSLCGEEQTQQRMAAIAKRGS